MAVATLHNVGSHAIHGPSVVSVLTDKVKVKVSVATAVVATHAAAVVASVTVNELVNAAQSAPTSAVKKFAAKPVQKVVVHVPTVAISVMSRELMQKTIKLLQIV
jgi:hypothetical protein